MSNPTTTWFEILDTNGTTRSGIAHHMNDDKDGMLENIYSQLVNKSKYGIAYRIIEPNWTTEERNETEWTYPDPQEVKKILLNKIKWQIRSMIAETNILCDQLERRLANKKDKTT